MARTTKITRFHGGKVEDLRTQSSIASSLIQHFDITNEHRLIPYRGFTADEGFAGGMTKEEAEIRKFVYVNGRFFGYGKKSSSDTEASVFDKTAGIGDFLSNDWEQKDSTSANARITNVFEPYKNSIYGFDAGGVWEFDTTNNTMTDSDVSGIGSVSGNDISAEPVHHPADDILYVFVNNVVHKNNDGTWANDELTLPSNEEIASGAPFGNYLTIATRPTDIYHKQSVIYFWNRNGALSTVSEKVTVTDRLEHVANLQGTLIAVGRSSDPASIADAGIQYLRIRNGRTGSIIKEFRAKDISFTANKVIAGDTLFFVMRLEDENGEIQQGIWGVKADGTLWLDQVQEDVATDGSPSYLGIYKTDQTWWVAHSGDGSIDRTGNTIDNTSIYESIIFTGQDSSQTKEIIGVSVSHAPLPSGASVKLKYRTDSDITNGNAFTEILDSNEQNTISKSAVRDTNNDEIPKYREIQFRIESTGGGEVTSFQFTFQETQDNVYSV